jgi:ribose 5-phosphate isomerase A
MSGQTSAQMADAWKEAAARAAVAYIADGMTVGLGTGSTASHAVRAIAERVATGLRIVGVATSQQTEDLARSLGVPLAELDDVAALDVTIDGADEIDVRRFHLIKGYGGALLREKLVALATRKQIIVGDESKVSEQGLTQKVPVEIVRFGAAHTVRALAGLGTAPVLRQSGSAPFITDEGHIIYDCAFGPIPDPAPLAVAIKSLPGVVEHGLFVGLTHVVIVAGQDGVRTWER